MAQRITKGCIECGELFEKPLKYSTKQFEQAKYCGFKCWGVHQSKVMQGHVSPMKGKKHTEVAKDKVRQANKKVNPISRTQAYRYLKSNERHARVKNAKGTFTHEEWMALKEKYGCKCAACLKSEHEVKLTIDHIVPLTKGGTNYISNIQPLCQSCNSRKGNRFVKTY